MYFTIKDPFRPQNRGFKHKNISKLLLGFWLTLYHSFLQEQTAGQDTIYYQEKETVGKIRFNRPTLYAIVHCMLEFKICVNKTNN